MYNASLSFFPVQKFMIIYLEFKILGLVKRWVLLEAGFPPDSVCSVFRILLMLVSSRNAPVDQVYMLLFSPLGSFR